MLAGTAERTVTTLTAQMRNSKGTITSTPIIPVSLVDNQMDFHLLKGRSFSQSSAVGENLMRFIYFTTYMYMSQRY